MFTLGHFLALTTLGLAFVGGGVALTWRLFPEKRRRPAILWLAKWLSKGVLLPLGLWAVMNLGLAWNLQPFMPEVQAAQNTGGPWLPAFLLVFARGIFLIGSYWAAVTLGWTLLDMRRGVDEPARLKLQALIYTCSLGLGLPALIILVAGGWPMLGLAACAILAPVAGYAPGILNPPNVPPIYARALARLKFGKYSEAEWEILRELEKCEDDFEGWMMLADLYANHFHDLGEAERTVFEICGQPKTTPSELAVALHRLADWHLKMAGDPEAARRALQIIGQRLPGSHLAHMAQLRLNQIPKTALDLKEQQQAKAIPLPALGDNLEEESGAGLAELDRKKAAAQANTCVAKLRDDPNDITAREQLARLFAVSLGQAERGVEQLALLLDMPDQLETKRAEWLSLTAAWHLKYRRDSASGRRILERLLREFPQSPQAFAARRRLELMAVSERQAKFQALNSPRNIRLDRSK